MAKKKIKLVVHKTINSKIQQGNIIFVSYGYARNYLIPGKIASLATHDLIKQSNKNRQIQSQKSQQQYNSIRKVKSLLEETNVLSLRRKSNQDYRFFGSIISKNIIKIIFEITGIMIDKKQIDLVPMRKIDIYAVKIQLSSDLVANVYFQILPVYCI